MTTQGSRLEALAALLPGIVYAGAVAFTATLVGKWMAPWFQMEALTIAILLGMLLNNTAGTPKIMKKGVDFAQKTLLLYGIVLLGFKINLQEIFTLGLPLILGIVAYMAFVFLLVLLGFKSFKLTPKLAALVAVGSSVCGSAAVVAMTPVIKASEEESVLAVTLVSFLGALGVVLMAIISGITPMPDITYGIWAGLTLHGVAHAIAGAFIRGEAAGEIGTFVKMTRVLMLVPVSIALSLLFNREEGTKNRAHMPLYLWGFIATAALNATGIVPQAAVALGNQLSHQLILIAMTAMGISVSFKTVFGRGLRVILFGLLLFTITSGTAYLILL